MNTYAFINQDGLVVQAIKGSLNQEQQQLFLRDYEKLFGAVQVIEVDEATPVWIGGSYTDGVFQAPPAPEPEAEPQPEPLPEPLTEPES